VIYSCIDSPMRSWYPMWLSRGVTSAWNRASVFGGLFVVKSDSSSFAHGSEC
jgi:hypothetical protein